MTCCLLDLHIQHSGSMLLHDEQKGGAERFTVCPTLCLSAGAKCRLGNTPLASFLKRSLEPLFLRMPPVCRLLLAPQCLTCCGPSCQLATSALPARSTHTSAGLAAPSLTLTHLLAVEGAFSGEFVFLRRHNAVTV